MQADTERLLERVRKLLALAGSPNIHEAALAASRAQELIDRHRLQRLLDADAEVDADISADRESPLDEGRRLRKWKRVLAQSLAELNGCVAYTEQRGRLRRIVLVGAAEDRAAVSAMWDGLVRRIEWLSATHLDGEGRDKRWHDAFRIGAVVTITDRLRESRRATTASLETTALALSEQAIARRRERVDRFVADNLHLKPGRGVLVDPDAYDAGRVAGARLTMPE
ncbi:MAG: sulfur relay (sulfurtransferase) complex TusBCD TusD component (DsrE family) [Myxococcota bacterium]|jgi:sulfur relay (sulfurtransferase) complex TusBCD TusD component (DsrE family)